MIGSRRSACDACRTRKLRCTRQSQYQIEVMALGLGSVPASESEHEPCERCLCAGILCVTTIASPSPGDSSATWDLYMTSPLDWAQDGPAELARDDRDDIANSSVSEPPISNLLCFQDPNCPDLTDCAFLASFLVAGDSFSSSSSSQLSPVDAGLNCHYSESYSHSHPHEHKPRALVDQGHDLRKNYRSSTEPPQPSPSNPATTCHLGSNANHLSPCNRLYSLYSSLSYQLFMSSAPAVGGGGEISVSSVLYAMSDFLTILLQLDRRRQKTDCNTVFVMLLCYLHIAALDRALLRKEREHLGRHHPMPPQLLIEGVSVRMCDDIRVMVLGMVVKEQFASIESIIGLAEEHCVSGRNGQHSGLLGGEESVSMLKAIMGTNHASGLGPDVVTTLREFLR